MINVDMDKAVLQDRLQELGWSTYKLAQEVGKIRSEVWGDEIKNPRSLVSALDKALENPDVSSVKTIEAMVRAMGGEMVIRWTETETIVTGHREVKV